MRHQVWIALALLFLLLTLELQNGGSGVWGVADVQLTTTYWLIKYGKDQVEENLMDRKLYAIGNELSNSKNKRQLLLMLTGFSLPAATEMVRRQKKSKQTDKIVVDLITVRDYFPAAQEILENTFKTSANLQLDFTYSNINDGTIEKHLAFFGEKFVSVFAMEHVYAGKNEACASDNYWELVDKYLSDFQVGISSPITAEIKFTLLITVLPVYKKLQGQIDDASDNSNNNNREITSNDKSCICYPTTFKGLGKFVAGTIVASLVGKYVVYDGITWALKRFFGPASTPPTSPSELSTTEAPNSKWKWITIAIAITALVACCCCACFCRKQTQQVAIKKKKVEDKAKSKPSGVSESSSWADESFSTPGPTKKMSPKKQWKKRVAKRKKKRSRKGDDKKRSK